MVLFHLVGREEWAAAQTAGTYAPPSLSAEGFIHLSTDRQLMNTADRWFAGRDDLLVISVRQDRLVAPVRFEWVDGELFPHLFGPLNLDAAVDAVPLLRAADGQFELPAAFAPWRAHFDRS